ncbi:hypothetical protein [Streptomyces sp. NBC_01497]|uniref:hypothetical protein n=1 Tax=Streptomyces sp. NBC_01497 TaxID=2903885 RepID=UPI002E31F336|nr:hypothetical protein [Streptomyces sp. NBC_01497]
MASLAEFPTPEEAADALAARQAEASLDRRGPTPARAELVADLCAEDGGGAA